MLGSFPNPLFYGGFYPLKPKKGSKFTEKPVFVPELFVLTHKRLDQDFFNMLTLILSEADGSKLKKES